MNLDRLAQGRDNNFDLIRLICAFMVLFGHSFPISGNGTDPISALILPIDWIGAIAVHAFFAISGFLVTASFVKRGALVFIVSRALRIYPGVIAFCLFAILVIGPIDVYGRISEYFAANPWHYLRNAALIDWRFNLPYAFAETPFGGATNGSTWSLPVELRCYFLVLLLGFLGVLESRRRANVALGALLYIAFTNGTALPIFNFNGEARNITCLIYFLVGALFWINREIIPVNYIVAAMFAPLIYIAAQYGMLHYVMPAGLVYAILLLAYRTPTVSLRRLGDISYGVYLYAWPI